MESHENKGNHGGGVFAWGGKACGKAQMSTQRPLCQRKTHEGLENGLANLWSRQKISKITKKAYAGRGHESKWEIPVYMSTRSKQWQQAPCPTRCRRELTKFN